MVFFRLTTSSSAWARSGSEAHSAADASSVARNRVIVNRSNLDRDIGRQNILCIAALKHDYGTAHGTPSTGGGQPPVDQAREVTLRDGHWRGGADPRSAAKSTLTRSPRRHGPRASGGWRGRAPWRS